MADRKQFKIMYPPDYHDKSKAGKPYHPPTGAMVMMSVGGVFFIVHDVNGDNTSVEKLSKTLFKYDVVWK